jgi:hypothetical protein
VAGLGRVERNPHDLRIDAVQEAVLPVAGDKSGQWRSWYRTAIPVADARFEEHLTRLKEEQS